MDLITAVLSLLAITVYAGRAVHANSVLAKITSDFNKGFI